MDVDALDKGARQGKSKGKDKKNRGKGKGKPNNAENSNWPKSWTDKGDKHSDGWNWKGDEQTDGWMRTTGGKRTNGRQQLVGDGGQQQSVGHLANQKKWVKLRSNSVENVVEINSTEGCSSEQAPKKGQETKTQKAHAETRSDTKLKIHVVTQTGQCDEWSERNE